MNKLPKCHQNVMEQCCCSCEFQVEISYDTTHERDKWHKTVGRGCTYFWDLEGTRDIPMGDKHCIGCEGYVRRKDGKKR